VNISNNLKLMISLGKCESKNRALTFFVVSQLIGLTVICRLTELRSVNISYM
jgi:hypothetical protein